MELIKLLWRDIDANSDGELSKAEVDATIAQGILTEVAVKSIDTDGDGAISIAELRSPKDRASYARRLGTHPRK